jgi:hypothetical protein
MPSKAGKLAALVVEAPNTLMDLRMLPIWEVPQNPKSTQEALKPASIILERLREAYASSAGPWD